MRILIFLALILQAEWLHAQFNGGSGSGYHSVLMQTLTVLPVQYAHISVNPDLQRKQVQISWTTAGEQQSDYFVVERSADARSWNALQYLAAAGNSQVPRDYHCVDEQVLQPVGYYRIRQVDINGDEHYSAMYPAVFPEQAASVSCDADCYTLYPNPFTEYVFLERLASNVQQVLLYNQQGMSCNMSWKNTGAGRCMVHVGMLPAGKYILLITDESGLELAVPILKQ